MTNQPVHPVRYHLRVPFSAQPPQSEIDALWRVIRTAQIDEVLFFVPHAEECSPGMGSIEECERRARFLAPLFDRLRAEGVAPSINIWWTVSFSDFPGLPRDQHDQFPFRWAAHIDGRPSRVVACPQDTGWREHIRQLYQVFARLRPACQWIDDDVRMTLRADMHCPCFCDVCLGEMTRRTGRAFSRPELLTAIMADPPNPVRDAWLEFQGDLGLEVVGLLARAVHEVSPETRVCYMHSGFEIHAAEGRRWDRVIKILGQPTPHFRPQIGPYVETTGPGILDAFNQARFFRAVLPAKNAVVPEIENYPHSRSSKSAKLVEADLVLSQLIGNREMTFSIYRFGGRMDLETRRERVWEELLTACKPRLQAIADLGVTPDQARGVGLYYHEDVCRHSRGVSQLSRPIFVYRQRPWDLSLTMMGFATRYGAGNVTAFAGEQIATLDEQALREVFRHGMLLDARAAETLLLMGQGGLAGLVRHVGTVGASLEAITDERFGELAGDLMNLRWEGAAAQFDWKPGARIISRLRSYTAQEVGHGVVLFENDLGGRVAVYPFDSQNGGVSSLGVSYQPLATPAFTCWTRQAQLKAVLEWMNRGPLPLFVPNAPAAVPLLAEQSDRLVIGACNLSPDPIANLTVQIAPPSFALRMVRALRPDGSWTTLTGAGIQKPAGTGPIVIETGLPLGYLDTAVVTAGPA